MGSPPELDDVAELLRSAPPEERFAMAVRGYIWAGHAHAFRVAGTPDDERWFELAHWLRGYARALRRWQTARRA